MFLDKSNWHFIWSSCVPLAVHTKNREDLIQYLTQRLGAGSGETLVRPKVFVQYNIITE